MQRIVVWSVLVVVALLIVGGHRTYVWLTNREPVQMSAAGFLQSDSKPAWVELRECELDWANAIQLESRVLGVDKGSFVPLRPAGARGKPFMLVKVSSELAEQKVLELVERVLTAEEAKGIESLPPEPAVVRGMVISLPRKEQSAIARGGEVQAGFVVIEQDARPNAADAVLFAGLLGLVVVLGIVILKKRAVPVAAPAAPGATPPPLPPDIGR